MQGRALCPRYHLFFASDFIRETTLYGSNKPVPITGRPDPLTAADVQRFSEHLLRSESLTDVTAGFHHVRLAMNDECSKGMSPSAQ